MAPRPPYPGVPTSIGSYVMPVSVGSGRKKSLQGVPSSIGSWVGTGYNPKLKGTAWRTNPITGVKEPTAGVKNPGGTSGGTGGTGGGGTGGTGGGGAGAGDDGLTDEQRAALIVGSLLDPQIAANARA